MKNLKLIFVYCFIYFLFNPSFIHAQIGVFTVNGDLSIASAGTYEVELKDLNGAGIGHDQTLTTGDLNLNGTLDVILSGYTPDAVDAFEILSFQGNLNGTFTNINWPTSMIAQGWEIDYGVLNPGKVTLYGPVSSLPVELLSFSVEASDEKHLLKWETASEINSAYFAVEYSFNGADYVSLDRVLSTGTSQVGQKYNYVYRAPQKGQHYYRLRMVDLDDRFEYSSIVTINDGNKGGSISIFPNPTTGVITLSESVPGLIIYDMQGKELLHLDELSATYDLSTLTAGTYLIRIQGEDAFSTEKLIIKK